jgi:transcription initiation factor TFIIH subunit 4
LDPIFKSQLRATLLGQESENKKEESTSSSVSLQTLATHAQNQWDNVLLQLLTPSTTTTTTTTTSSLAQQRLLHVLVKSGLLNDSRTQCTTKGYRFLLSDTPQQVWTLLHHYIDFHAHTTTDRMNILNFLLHLHFLTLGKSYQLRNLNNESVVRKLLNDLHYLGIVYVPSETESRVVTYFSTPLANQLLCSDDTNFSTSSTMTTSSILHQREHIIVETNFHLYAYEPTRVTEHLLALFTTLTYRLPNLLIARLTRQSVQRAFRQFGLTAEQILSFLQRNAHVQCRQQLHLRGGGVVVPESVADQLRHWENERKRIVVERGVLYDGFSSSRIFTLVETYAQQLAVLRYSNPLKRQLVVTESAHEVIKQYIKSITTSENTNNDHSLSSSSSSSSSSSTSTLLESKKPKKKRKEM